MDFKNRITFREAADFILKVLPKELAEKPIEEYATRRPTTFKEEFLKQGQRSICEKTVFTEREDLERAVFCILEDWQKGREEFDGYMFNLIFISDLLEEF